jgi:hypothetical protein
VNWREIGDTTVEAYISEFTRLGSPMLGEAKAVYDAARPHSALCLAMLWVESKYATISDVPVHFKNPLHQTRAGASPADGVNRWMRFSSYEQAVRFWRERLTSPTGPYANTVTLEDLIHVYAPSFDGNNEALYVDHIERIVAALPKAGTPPPPESDPLPTKPKILLTRGHGTTGDTGAFANGQSEEAHNKRIVPAVARILRQNGWDVTTYPDPPESEASGNLDTEGAFARDWMARLGGQPGVMLDCHLESSSAKGIFAIVPNLAHLVTGAAARQHPNDQWNNNVGDRALGKAICREIHELSGVPVRTQWVREPGLMSEDMTWVGQGGGGAYAPSRLAMFGYTSPYVDTVYRLVVEFANLQHDKAYYTKESFPDQCGLGILSALNAHFGATVPAEPPVEKIPEEVRHAYPGAIIRERPDTNSKIKVSYKKRTAIRVVAKATNGQTVGGSNEWFQIKSKGPSNKGFIHISGLYRVETV